jgi:hypothetical protein
MLKIKTILFHYMRNEAHLEFQVVFIDLLDKFPAVKALVATFYDTCYGLLGQAKKLVDAARKSSTTQKLIDADRRVDRDVVTVGAAIRAALNHFEPAVADAARVLYDRLKVFGDIKTKAYKEESAAVQLLLSEFTGALAPQVALVVGLDAWLAELTEAEAEFMALFALRNTELADRPHENLRDVYRQFEVEYGKATTCLNTDLILHGEATCGDFVRQLNEQIKYFNEHNHQRSKKDLAAAGACVVEPIPTQTYTGKPIAVIPTVSYREANKPDKELVFATDFTVTYKDNTEAGTATVIIHGKGAYKGQKVGMFTIINND